MTTYKIVGLHTVCGREPGESVTDEDLEGYYVDALIEGGHIIPDKARKAVSATNQED